MRVVRNVIGIGAIGIGLVLAAGCNQNGQRAATDRRTAERAENASVAASQQPSSARGPTTNPSAQQRVVTDPASLAKATLAGTKGGPAFGKRDDKLTPLALFYGPMPTCFDFTSGDRLFVNFPRWERPTNFTVAEVRGGQLVPYPDAKTNEFSPSEPDKFDVHTHLVSVQAVVVDAKDRLWILDTGSINMQPRIPGATKMWAYDTRTNKRVKEVTFTGALKPKTYINDVRFDLTRGREGYAFVTDSGEGGIIVVDLATGECWRKLDGHPSVKADTSIALNVEGEPLKRRPAGTDKESPVEVHSDGIAISPDGKTLYWTPMVSHAIYAVPTDALVDRNADAAAQVRKVADKPSANDGLFTDSQGRVYSTDYEDNAIRRFTPGAGAMMTSEVVFQDERLLWPDCVIVRGNRLFVTSNQLNRQGGFHHGDVQQVEPFVIFEYPIAAKESPKEGKHDK